MSRHPITEQHLVYRTPAMDAVEVDRDRTYADGASPDLAMDVYRRPDASAPPAPAVILTTGYSDVGGRKLLGCDLKDMAAYVDWARLLASAGIVAVTYRNEDPLRDARRVLAHLIANAGTYGIDAGRIGLWSCSGNVPTALALFAGEPRLACAAMLYGYLMDLPGNDEVATAAAQFGFVNATRGLEIGSVRDRPLLVVRAGRDEMPGLNASLDRFTAAALGANLALTVVNQAAGRHAFDIADSSDASIAAIRQVVGFFVAELDIRAGR